MDYQFVSRALISCLIVYSQVSHFSQIGVSVQEAEQNERYTVKHIPFGKQMVIEYKNETDAEM